MARSDRTKRKGGDAGDDSIVAEGVGGVSGAATGAALGSLAGPLGTIVGGLAGAVGGWWMGREVSEAATSYESEHDSYYQSRFQSAGSAGGSTRLTYDDARPAYAAGHLAAVNPDYRGRSFEEVEPHLQQAFTTAGNRDWSQVRGYAQDAFTRGREVSEQRLTLAEEELRVGTRQVQAGEVALRKTVETEHVTEQVPLTREEVTIERRPVSSENVRAGNVEITADEIRIPVMAEEAVVEKRVVGKEEVVVRKDAVTETQSVEADLRRERLDVQDTQVRAGRQTGATTAGLSGAQDRATNSGPLDRLADKADDLKDRVDGNPASRPGPDSTDSRI